MYIDNTPLQAVTTQKYLGVIFDDKLQWSSHMYAVTSSDQYNEWVVYAVLCLIAWK